MFVQVIVSCTRAAQVVVPKPPANPLPPMDTSVAVGATPCPVHANTAVIVTGAVEPKASDTGLTAVTSIVVAIPP